MGEAKRRHAEIEELKRTNPELAALWRQLQTDKRRIAPGIDPVSPDPEPVAAMARALSVLFGEAKRTGNIDPPVTLLQTTTNATLQRLSAIPVACKKGCSHCCHTWVSVSAPEALFTAKIIKQRGDAAIGKVRLAHQHTKDYDFDTRVQHPYPCPLLEGDVCSIYDSRPKTCRLAASADAEICARTYHNITDEDVPTPAMYLSTRSVYTIAMAAGLRHANLPYHGYEFNAVLVRALETDNAEQRWLVGEDLFTDIHRDPADIFAHPQAQRLYEHAFALA
jgi:Fe-S-cluster containining protein